MNNLLFFQEVDTELGQTGAAGLASIETLDDGTAEKSPIANEDGMETVRLDGEDGTDRAEPPKHPLVVCISALRKHVVVSGTRVYRVYYIYIVYFVIFIHINYNI